MIGPGDKIEDSISSIILLAKMESCMLGSVLSFEFFSHSKFAEFPNPITNQIISNRASLLFLLCIWYHHSSAVMYSYYDTVYDRMMPADPTFSFQCIVCFHSLEQVVHSLK